MTNHLLVTLNIQRRRQYFKSTIVKWMSSPNVVIFIPQTQGDILIHTLYFFIRRILEWNDICEQLCSIQDIAVQPIIKICIIQIL